MAPGGALLIQSDKPKYKPGDDVKFRLLSMDFNLKPIEPIELNYTIRSPKPDNYIMAQKSYIQNTVVYNDTFHLDTFASLGKFTSLFAKNLTHRRVA